VTVDEFIAKWENCSGSERANYAVFLTELAGVLGVDAPGPSDDYRIDAPVPGGAEAGGTGFIDLYKRGCFILEASRASKSASSQPLYRLREREERREARRVRACPPLRAVRNMTI
jgi:hypothetical protein